MLKRTPYLVYWGIFVIWLSFVLMVAFQRFSTAQSGVPIAIPQSSLSAALPRGDVAHMYVEVPPEDVGHMYNAITEDESELRDMLVAIPVVLTLLLAFAPYLLSISVSEKVREAVDARVKAAEDALTKAKDTYDLLDRKMDLKIGEERALLFFRLAYLHWSLEDLELAVHYATRACESAGEALRVTPDNRIMRDFERDANDSWAYYVAESVKPGMVGLGEPTDKGRDHGVAILAELTGAKGAEPDVERVDTCLFVLWVFRDSISEKHRQEAAKLYENWARTLGKHPWKRRQRENYVKYKAYYESLTKVCA